MMTLEFNHRLNLGSTFKTLNLSFRFFERFVFQNLDLFFEWIVQLTTSSIPNFLAIEVGLKLTPFLVIQRIFIRTNYTHLYVLLEWMLWYHVKYKSVKEKRFRERERKTQSCVVRHNGLATSTTKIFWRLHLF